MAAMARQMILAAALLAALAACSTDDPADPASGPATTTDVVEGDDAAIEAALPYFEAMATNNATGIEPALSLSEPGSPAHMYATHQMAMWQIDAQARRPPIPAATVEVRGQSIVLETTNENGEEVGSTASDLEVDPTSGLLMNFTLDGTAIDDRMAVGGLPVEDDGVTVQPYSAYQAVTNDILYVVLEVTNDTAGPFTGSVLDAAYVSPDGTQAQVLDAYEPREVQPGATALIAMLFPDSPLGGQLFYSGFLNDFATEVSVELAIE